VAGLSASPAASSPELRVPGVGQMLAIIATLRWRLFVNSMRTIRGRLEAVSRLFAVITMFTLAFGGAFALGGFSYFAVDRGKFVLLAALLWVVFAFWQMYPIIGSAFAAPFEFGNLLRFPMAFSSYYVLNLAFALLDPVSLVCLFWLLGMFVGVAVAEAALIPWAFVILTLYGVLNVLLSRAVYVWLERWLAQRRTREVLGVVFLFAMIGMQMVGPILARVHKRSPAAIPRLAALRLVSNVLPPGLAEQAIADAHNSLSGYAVGAIGALCVYTCGIAALLGTRLHAQFIGENVSESLAPVTVARTGTVRPAWNLPLLSPPVAAIFEKEMLYLVRSAPMIFTFVMPLFVLVIFRFAPQRGTGGASFLVKAPDWAFPIGAAYAMLILTNIVYNSFGADGGGLQLFITAPVRVRDVFFAKNLAHSTVLALAIAAVLIATISLYRPPSIAVTLGTLCALLFALPLNLAIGNLMSLYSPKKYDFSAFNRQRATGVTALVTMGVEITIVAVATGVFFLARFLHRVWLAGVMFLPLAAISLAFYWFILNLAARRALERREILIAEICRV
jgi:ABC-2 type transport system permease protein